MYDSWVPITGGDSSITWSSSGSCLHYTTQSTQQQNTSLLSIHCEYTEDHETTLSYIHTLLELFIIVFV